MALRPDSGAKGSGACPRRHRPDLSGSGKAFCSGVTLLLLSLHGREAHWETRTIPRMQWAARTTRPIASPFQIGGGAAGSDGDAKMFAMFVENRIERLVQALRARASIPLRFELWNGRRF